MAASERLMPISRSITCVGRGRIIMKTMQTSMKANIRSLRWETARRSLVSMVLPLAEDLQPRRTAGILKARGDDIGRPRDRRGCRRLRQEPIERGGSLDGPRKGSLGSLGEGPIRGDA